MVSCKQCGMHNSLDSTFCKKCGTAVAEADVQEARAKLDVMVAEGNTAFNEGRTDEALAISESVLFSDPDHIPGLWLKAICHERKDEIARALECADRIVELNPNSELDKIRRSQLRNKLSVSLQVYEKPDRRVALVGAISATVLVICAGVLAAALMKRQPEAKVVPNTSAGTLLADNSSAVQNPILPQQQGTPTDPQVNNATNPQLQPGPGDVPAITQQPQQQRLRGNNDVQLPPPVAGGQLPGVNGNIGSGGIGEVDVQPVTPPVPPSSNNRRSNEDPTDTFPVNPGGAVAQNDPDPGQIEIDVYSSGSKNNNRTATPVRNEGNGLEARVRTAYQAFQIGNFQQAANLFEQALSAGGDPVTLNQRLGQSYERLGRTGDAISAYRRAVTAGEQAISQGKANPTAINTAVESSRQALKKLGG